MKSKAQIEKVLKDLGIIYKCEEMAQNNVQIDTYLIHLVSDNKIFFGGVLDGGAADDKHITIMFFCNPPKCDDFMLLKKVNELNKGCKYGNFTYDGEDIVYNLAIPVINNDIISEAVFKFYFEKVISIVNGVADELKDE